jgi:AbrB family looped-hinge helix DNA binding protein
MPEEPQVTTISEKGQIVIPQSIRKMLGIKPGTKFLVFGKGDIVILKRLELPDMKKEWSKISKVMDKKNLILSDGEIQKEVAETRKKRKPILEKAFRLDQERTKPLSEEDRGENRD